MSQFAENQQPLSDRERALLNRLLSDPSIYPQVFKGWLVPYLEGTDMVLPVSGVHGLSARLDKLENPAVATRLDELEARVAVLEAKP